ncbi:carbohydrate ABC transporter permease [Paenibacillus radicis (ex Xue et al. 2023)]|uniref:Carbohydrate ABC transporter permease n=1 Tax=Paenibacillus radicis (ex Xue et al. 2023) TaxID=2972489 RepID=A0ABT1YIR6_9BACL|nr:carbohydrate ABC transporter permease [Paenibacillus radicis (ex Xue et al. 2023)]MCR8633061.1 carbohydrate ABC transporter permease [Paenibacillus radicis (ex Xue et al. 2023)]
MKAYDFRGRAPIYQTVVYTLLVLVLIIVLIPFLYVVFASFATKQEILTRGFFLIPRVWTTNAYAYLMVNQNFLTSFKNSTIIAIAGTTISMTLTTLMAYGLSKTWLKGRKLLNFMVLFTMLFSGGIIPLYLLVRGLNLLDSYWSLFLTGAIAPFNLIVIRSSFQNFPTEIEESARIDGCSEFGLLWKIVLPLSKPVLATFTLFYTVDYWNSYFSSILYLTSAEKMPLQVFLRQMLIQPSENMGPAVEGLEFSPAVRMAAVVFTAIPLLVVYPFLQKYFNQGMLLGSVKG